jgi:hypothetical protein
LCIWLVEFCESAKKTLFPCALLRQAGWIKGKSLFSHEGEWRRGSTAPLIPPQYNGEDAFFPRKPPRQSVEAVWAFWRRDKSHAPAQNRLPDRPYVA